MANTNLTVKKGQCINFGNCTKANAKEVVEVNLGDDFICPECGADLIEKPHSGSWIKDHKSLVIIIAAVLILGGIGAGGYSWYQKIKNAKKLASDMVEVVDTVVKAIPQGKDSTYLTESGVIQKEVPKPTPTSESVKVTGGTYTGQSKGSKPHGMGTIRYTSHTLIDSRDPKKRYAEAGYTLTGEFFEGRIVQGVLKDKDGELVEKIIIGR